MGAQNYPATMQCVWGVHAGWVEVQAGVGSWGCGGPDVAPSPGDTEPRDQCQALCRSSGRFCCNFKHSVEWAVSSGV